MTPRHYLLAAGLAIAAWLALFADKTPKDQIAEPVVRSPVDRGAASTSAPRADAGVTNSPHGQARIDKTKQRPEPAILALRSREELIGGASSGSKPDGKSGGAGAGAASGLFGPQSWTPPPPPPPKPPPPPPPTAPAVPFAYIGKKMEDGTWEVYLARGEHTFIVKENSMIEGTYRIDSIRPPTLTLTYLPLNQMQTLTIGGME